MATAKRSAKRPAKGKMVKGSVRLGYAMTQWGVGGNPLMSVGSHFVGGHAVSVASARRALTAAKRLRETYPRDASLKQIDGALTRLVGARKTTTHRANPVVACRGKSDTYNRYRNALVLHNGEWVKVDGCWAGAPAKVPSYHGTVKRTGKGTTIAKKVVRQKASRTAKRVKGVRARSRK